MSAVRPAARSRFASTRAWSQEGNHRVTAAAGLVLVVLLAIEAVTTLNLHALLPLHLFLGVLVLPPVALKLGGTGWRFARYYTGSKAYRLAGPPKLPMRLLAPLLVVSTLTLFGSGVWLIVVGHGGGWILRLHAASFAVWGVLLIVHVAVYLPRALRDGTADWRRRTARAVPGARARRGLLVGALVVGVIVAVATYPAQQAFHSRGHERGLKPAGIAYSGPRERQMAAVPADAREARGDPRTTRSSREENPT